MQKEATSQKGEEDSSAKISQLDHSSVSVFLLRPAEMEQEKKAEKSEQSGV